MAGGDFSGIEARLDAIAAAIAGGLGMLEEVWIAAKPQSPEQGAGTGTPHDPYDGGSQEKFDALLPTIPEYTVIHLGVGTFITGGIQTKETWIIDGQGKDLTIVQLANGSADTDTTDAFIFLTPSFFDYAQVSNLTLDCNRDNQGIYTLNLTGTLNGAALGCKSGKLENVKLVGAYANPGEGFPLRLEHDGSTDAVDFHRVRGCEVIDPIGYMTALCFFDQSGGTIAGVVEECLVANHTDGTSIGAGGGVNVTIRGNRVLNGKYGFLHDTGDASHYNIHGNHIEVSDAGVVYNGTGVYDDFRVHDNFIAVSGSGSCVLGNVGSTTSRQLIYGNVVETAGSAFSLAGIGLLSNNIVTETTPSTIPAGVTPVDNYDEGGNAIY